MLKPLPARLLRYALYLLALLLIGITILLWQAPTLIQRHLPGWLATHYGLHLSLGKIEVGIRSPSLVLGPSALLDDKQQALVSFEELKLIPALKASWQQRALVLEEATLTAPRADLVRLEDLKGEARFNLTDALASLLAPAPEQTPPASAEPVLVTIGKLSVEQGRLSYRDSRKQSSPGWVPPLTLDKLALHLPGFSSAEGVLNPYRLSATVNEKSPLKAEGEFDMMSGAGKGNLRFADRSLSPEFVVDIASLDGQSRHISNTPGQRSELAFNGKVDRYAPVTIRGGANLLIEDPVLDVAVAFNNLELTTFTPYSSTYAGYAIDKGQLSMKLNYKLQGNRLEGDNDITIKKLQLGEKVKSEQAKDLPLGLAIALLSDSNGVIKMNLKVKGNLDQPDFSLGNIFWDVLGNTLGKAITSPFSLLASLTGGTKDLDELPFLPGDPALTPTQQTKLTTLAQALKERPKLSMNIRGKVNFNEERPILQRQKLERLLAKTTGSPVDLTLLEQDPAMQSALAEAYEAKFNEDLGDLADRLRLDEGSEALRAQAVLLLRDQQLITAKSLRNLAMRRAQNTKEYLVDTQGIAPERLFVLDSQVKETDKEAKVVLTLDN
ncbi:DUF748 domain-containing protein [Aeromonas sp. PrichA-15]|uniref:DUF748 domain-containing protein n=1 Tax=Aeromonas sp. PrichA-15 TaxID=2823360 RepID=UPI001FF0953A|nr:DUF748 domain-containing protein [Aeromonas sp. PrichA-15]